MFANRVRGSGGASSIAPAVDVILKHVGFAPEMGLSGASSASGSGSVLGSSSATSESYPVTRRLEVAQAALQAVLGTPMPHLVDDSPIVGADGEALSSSSSAASSSNPFRHVHALRRAFAARTEAAMKMTVPRDFVNEIDGFIPFFLAQARLHASQMRAAQLAHDNRTKQYSHAKSRSSSATVDVSSPTGAGPLDNEELMVERLLDWMELFYPEKDYRVLPIGTLLAAVEGFFVYQKGGINTGLPFDHIRPYHGIDMPVEESELSLYRVLYHWVAEFGVPSKTFQTMLDCGVKSGYMSALMIKANMPTVVAVDDNEFALQNLQDNLRRLRRRGAIKKKAVYTLRSNDLLPISQQHREAMMRNGGGGGSSASASSSNPFLSAAQRRRMVGRMPHVNAAGIEDDTLETRLADGTSAMLSELAGEGGASGPDGISTYDLLTFHRPVPSLYVHPMLSRSSAHVAGGKHDTQFEQILSLLESSPKHEGLLHKGNGHVAVISSNFHELLQCHNSEFLPNASLAHSIAERTNTQFNTFSGASSSRAINSDRVVGWDIVKRERRGLSSHGARYLGADGNSGAMFRALVANGPQGYAAMKETQHFYSRLQHEFIVLKPRYLTLFGGVGKGRGAEGGAVDDDAASAGSAPRPDAVNPFASNDAIDWEDTFEYNNYLPRDGTGNPFHITSATNTYSYLEDDYYGDEQSALTIGAGSDRLFYNRNDPADALGRLPRANLAGVQKAREKEQLSADRKAMRYNKDGEASANDAFVKDGASLADRKDLNPTTGTTPMFDLVFNREMRLKRQRKWRKLAFDSGQRERFYLDKKVVDSQAAKLQMLNELDRFDFRDPTNRER